MKPAILCLDCWRLRIRYRHAWIMLRRRNGGFIASIWRHG